MPQGETHFTQDTLLVQLHVLNLEASASSQASFLPSSQHSLTTNHSGLGGAYSEFAAGVTNPEDSPLLRGYLLQRLNTGKGRAGLRLRLISLGQTAPTQGTDPRRLKGKVLHNIGSYGLCCTGFQTSLLLLLMLQEETEGMS